MSAVVRFEAVSKRYRRGRERSNFRAAVPGRFGGRLRGDLHWALRDLSFELEPGRSLGIVGPNGAGKSTTLKLVAGVIAASSGQVSVRGRTASLIELGAGFHPDMTGRENVHFSAAVLGMRPRSVRARFDEIVDFADIGTYLDTPVKRYSSGMMARLGFAVAAHIDADVVVLDEVLAVGDAQFQSRCHERIRAVREEGVALLYVTHALWTVPVLCDEAILLADGTPKARGLPDDILRAYESMRNTAVQAEGSRTLLTEVVASATVLERGDGMTIEIGLDLDHDYPDGQILVQLVAGVSEVYATISSRDAELTFPGGRQRVRCTLSELPLQPGPYDLAVIFFGNHAFPVVDDALLLSFEIRGGPVNPKMGSLCLPASWAQAQD